MKPKEIRRSSGGLQIIWSDGKLDVVDYARLRLACTCAVCREMPSHPDYRDARFERSRSVHSLDLVGNYAVGIMWADSHRSIFAFDRIKNLPPLTEEKISPEAEVAGGCCGGGCH